MKRCLISAVCCLVLLCMVDVRPQAQAADEATAAERATLHVQRARRLREYDFPLLARAQLDHARRLDPGSKAMLVEYLRLYTHGVGNTADYVRYAATLRDLYPEDYEACLELAWWLYWAEAEPQPPVVKDRASLTAALKRIDDEMAVYRALAGYILKAEGDQPAAAGGKPALPLAYLARCVKARPGSADVLHLAGLDLERRGRDFFKWSTLFDPDSELEGAAHKAFEMAAKEIYGLAVPLFEAASKHEAYYVTASVTVANLLFRMGKYPEAARALVIADMAQEGNVSVAQTRLALAEVRGDMAAVMDAVLKLHMLYGDPQSELDLRAARRVLDKEWGFAAWSAWSELQSIRGIERTGALRAMLSAWPEFLEVYYLDALNAFEFARMAGADEDRQRFLLVVLKALEHCEALGSDFSEWHRLQADALWILREFAQAADAYSRVVALDPDDFEAPRHAAAARDIAAGLYSSHDYGLYRNQLDESGDLREKLKVLREVVTRSPKFFHALQLMGKVATILSEFETAYGAYAAAHELRPDNIECLQGAARAAQHTGRMNEALKFFEALVKLVPGDASAVRMEGIMRWVTAGNRDRQQAFRLWLQSMSEAVEPTRRRSLLEEASLLEPEFAEVLVELAALDRLTRREAAENYLTRALRCVRDDETRAAAHTERGRLRLSQLRHREAVTEFESAFSASPGDGIALLLASLAHREMGNHKDSAAALRRLFAEVPASSLFRPKLRELEVLDPDPAPRAGLKRVHPDYDVGAVMNFRTRIEAESEGGELTEKRFSVEYSVRAEVLDKPLHSGFWRLKLRFSEADQPFDGMDGYETTVRISPWYGIIETPEMGVWAEILNPMFQALAEGFTVGIGDAAIAPPYIWKNDLTIGPARFNGAVEGAWLRELVGEEQMVRRRAIAGRQLGLPGDDQHNHSRALEARVTVNGATRALQEIEFTVMKKELTRDRDDVEQARLYVRMTAR